MTWLYAVAAIVIFVTGLRLSAFFSGSETGFYRVSFLQLSIDAQAGDTTAKRLCWYLRHPAPLQATVDVSPLGLPKYISRISGLLRLRAFCARLRPATKVPPQKMAINNSLR